MRKSSTIASKTKAEAQRTVGTAKVISIRGARVHNLKNISLEIPRNKLIVITGVSGSGKSSLAFDTIYAEGQRRYVESLSAYARQFLERMDKPDVDMIQGLSPAIAIEQKTNTRNPRSTVATTTEVYDYLRLLFARIGKTYCEVCGKLVARDSVHTAVDRLNQFNDGAKFYIAFPLPSHENKTVKQEVDALKKRGFFRFIVNGEAIDSNEQKFSPKEKESIFVLIDRFVLRKKEMGYGAASDSQTRLADSIQTAFEEGEGYAAVFDLEAKSWLRFNQHFECPDGHVRYEEPTPQLFSFNSPVGACPKCQGFGRSVGLDMDLIVPDKNKTIRDGAIQPWTTPKFRENLHDLLAVAYEANVPVNVPFSDLTDAQLNVVMNGFGRRFDGINGFFKMVERKSYKIQYRVLLSKYRGYTLCDECGGSRLRKEARSVKINDKTAGDVVRMTIEDADAFFKSLTLTDFEMSISRRILDEIQKRLRYLVEVGLGYLTLDRLSSTLSGGESQRINLATSLGSSLVGSVYVLDEPSIGLHPVDNDRLIRILKSLRDLGNTIIVVEHDADMMRAADVLIDMGPFAGERGGEVTYFGTAAEAAAHPVSLTGKYLSGELYIPIPAARRKGSGKLLKLKNAFHHNLKNIDVEFPLNMLVCVTGVSGSGKSTLVHDVLFEGIKKRFETKAGRINGAADLLGVEELNGVELVDQSPIGRTPRSNAVTYIKAFDVIRDLLANTQMAKVHGYQPGFFSFNVPGGRCETCEGDGVQKIEMQFMADLYLVCESCKGKRYKEAALAVRYDGKNVDDILSMTVNEAIEFFSRKPTGQRVAQRLKVLDDVGLGYLRLGQAATTLSGGEAQRVKLAAHLSAKETADKFSEQEGNTLFIFDEPTTGLHFDDIAKLLKCFTALITAGHSVLLIEHNLDVIKCADYLIDLGPGGGESGGKIIAKGTPEEVARVAASHTGKFLKKIL
jgi:excinuclease ABC subunit A